MTPLPPAKSRLADRFQPALVVFALVVALCQATRLLLLALRPQVLGDGLLPVGSALAVGIVFDLLVAAWVAAPWVLYLAVAPERWLRTRVQRALCFGILAAVLYGSLFVAAAESFFFDEFESRFNFVAVDYLLYPTEVLTNIWQSYPTGWILALLGVATASLIWNQRRRVAAAWQGTTRFGTRLGVAACFALVLVGSSYAVPADLGHVSEDRLLNEIAANGYYSFWNAVLGADVPYDGFYATREPAAVLARLPRLLAEPEAPAGSFVPGSDRRKIRPLGPERRLNVVVVLEESLGAEFISALHPRTPSLSPEIDRLIAEGTLLANAHSTGNRTIRAIEASTAGLPPLPGESVVRRPTSKGLFTLPGLLRDRGYRTLFVYGGHALFDNMGSYLLNNGVERVVDQADFPDTAFATAWGVCDEAIFDRALADMDVLAAAGQPFYTLVLTTSNHRPFEFPQQVVQRDPTLSRRENAVRYADHALGRFVGMARERPYFGSTLFVLLGDHGARVYGAGQIPLPSYEVPILFLAPGVVPAGQRIELMTSTLDVPPTILGLLGTPYESRFFGRDLFHLDPAWRGLALLNHNHEVALWRDDRMAVLGLQRSIELFTVGGDAEAFTPLDRSDPAGAELVEDAIAYYQGGDYLYRNGGYQLETPPVTPSR